jgi:hypothetical protein
LAAMRNAPIKSRAQQSRAQESSATIVYRHGIRTGTWPSVACKSEVPAATVRATSRWLSRMGPKVTGTKFAVGQAVRVQDPPHNGKAGRWNDSERILEVNAGRRSYIVQVQDGPLRNRNERFLKLVTARRHNGNNVGGIKDDASDNDDGNDSDTKDSARGNDVDSWQVQGGRPPGKCVRGQAATRASERVRAHSGAAKGA